MILKLAIQSMKGKMIDYLVLFTGLAVSVSVFYMFLTLSVNKDFITSNSIINSIQFVFVVGTFLLAFVTFFYVLFASSFLLSLRKKEFGTYMLLGVKKRQIKRMALIENLAVGAISIVIGSLVGIALSKVTSILLTKQLDISLDGYHSLYPPSLGLTVLFFLILFFITSVWNNRKISKSTVLELLNEDKESDTIPTKPKWGTSKLILGFILLAMGYASLVFMEQLENTGLMMATAGTTLGTYLLFSTLLPLIVKNMKSSKRNHLTLLNTFTFSQLSFRVNELKIVLATISMLIALSAGAIAGGFAFMNNVGAVVNKIMLYDTTLFNVESEDQKILDTLPFIEKGEYRFKIGKDHIYFIKEELMANPPLIEDWITYEIRRANPTELETEFEINEYGQLLMTDDWHTAFRTISPDLQQTNRIITLSEYNTLDEEEASVFIGKTENFLDHMDEWTLLFERQLTQFEKMDPQFDRNDYYIYNKYTSYLEQYSMSSGILFMSFFLGIAFMAMMASTLMFKVLSGATKDIVRYEMLRKMGVRHSLLSKSISKELFLIFLFPGLVGIMHVLIGMNMFSFIILNPYYRIWVSLLFFVVIYALYYGITVYMYKKIVLPNIHN